EDKWSGDLITYYAYDLWPDEGKSHAYPVPADRYRLRLSHNQNIDKQDYLMVQANYISDPYIIEQFFREEYKTDPEPDNYLVLGRRGQYYAASLMFRKRFNDFYTAIDRLPEATLDFTRQQIWDTPFYYEGKHTAAYLSKEWEKNLLTNNANYSTFRFDTPNMIYYPTKQFGFLNIIPRAGWEGTVYSAGCVYYTNLVTTTYVDTNGVTQTKVSTNILNRSGDAQFRSMPKLGLETSFKAFKVWETYPGTIINNIRHIAEPYADYSFVPEPNVLSTNLYQFDNIDALGKVNEIKIGMRNKIQTQRFGKLAPSSRSHIVADLINADIWTTYRVAREQNQNLFANISYDIRSTPVDGLELFLDGEFDQYESRFHTVNTRLALFDDPIWRYELEHRYLENSNSLLNNELKFSPVPNWLYSIYVRYDFYDQHMEAYGVTIQKIIDCITAKVGFEQQTDDDFTVWLQFWFTQFPKVRVDVGL
ncbi:MAG: LPS assembly protein LptD, partial [Kiritimatiellia bacterium]|nr:LPS assembly protein LptD [Kiritimatiellia bacterium]